MKPTILFILICSLIFSEKILAQDMRADSLLLLISEENKISDDDRVLVLLDLCKVMRTSSIDSAYEFCRIAHELSRRNHDKELEYKALNSISIIHAIRGNYVVAIDMQIRCAEYYKSQKDDFSLSEVYLNLGNSFLKLKKYYDALDAYTKSLEIKEKFKDEIGVSKLYNNIGSVYSSLDLPERALEYHHKALEIRTRFQEQNLILQSLSNIASIYKETDRTFEAEQICMEGIELAKKINDNVDLAYFYLYLGDCYREQKKFKEAIKAYHAAFKPAHRTGLQTVSLDLYKGLALSHKRTGRLDSSLHYFEVSMTIKDSLYSENKLLEIGRLENKYTLERKDYENKLLLHEQEISKEQQKRQKIILIAIIAFAVLLIAGTVALWRNIRLKNEINAKLITQSMALTTSNALIQQKNEVLEEQSSQLQKQKEELFAKNTQITDSIRSAKHIQEAIVTVPQGVHFDEKQNFILWLPRDIVSGDFFWIEKIDEHKTIFAVADCTGHGIPGAFMSLLGVHFLEFIVLSEKITSPEKILDALDFHTRKSLKDDKENQYGMDIAVCILDTQMRTLEFSGAHIDLHYWDEKALQKIKGDRKSIGTKDKKNGVSYEKKVIPFELAKRIWLSSDGFADQLNAERKRFGTQRLTEVLAEIAEKSTDEQKMILQKTISDWRGEQEQTDDIILMSIAPESF